MINHLLVPLDGSSLAECVLPHVIAVAQVSKARVTLLYVMQQPGQGGRAAPAVDPIEWHLQKQNSEKYLDQVVTQLNDSGVPGVERAILEGSPANMVIEFARSNNVDLIVLSTHGQSGLSGWNVSSVVQKILLGSGKSILLVRAYMRASAALTKVRYRRLFIGMDGSARSEFVLPFAVGLAQYHKSQLLLETVIERPRSVNRFPLSGEEEEWINTFVQKNYQAASRYLEQLVTQFSMKDIRLKAHVSIADNAISVLHDLAEEANADLVLLAAHGYSGEKRWPYGSVTTSFIAYGNTSLLILQDLPEDEIQQTRAEQAVRPHRGR